MTEVAVDTPPGVAAPTATASRRDTLAAWLYRHRGTTALPFAFLAVIGARPGAAAIAVGAVLIGAGEWLRLAAASEIGAHSRGLSLRAPRLATDGPYAWMRHPLYAGNGVVCAGLLVFSGAYFPWLPLIFVPAFLFQYGLFMRREEKFLAGRFGNDWLEYCRRVPRLGIGFATHRRRNQPEADLAAPAAARAHFPGITIEGWKLEWPTVRTILALVALVLISAWVQRRM